MTQQLIYLYGFATSFNDIQPKEDLTSRASPIVALIALDFKDHLVFTLVNDLLEEYADADEGLLTYRDVDIELTTESWSSATGNPLLQQWVFSVRPKDLSSWEYGQVVVQKRFVTP